MIWKIEKVQERFGAHLVRYADDCVVLCKDETERILKGVKSILNNLGLTLNEEKTTVVDARQDSFSFLGVYHCNEKGAEKRTTLSPHHSVKEGNEARPIRD
jgi:retron-type reverse transcriptase